MRGDIYISKDTVVVYAHEEDKSCEYLEVNEVIESIRILKLDS